MRKERRRRETIGKNITCGSVDMMERRKKRKKENEHNNEGS